MRHTVQGHIRVTILISFSFWQLVLCTLYSFLSISAEEDQDGMATSCSVLQLSTHATQELTASLWKEFHVNHLPLFT